MIRLLEEMEQERRRMNELGQALLEQSIPLSVHEELLVLSQKVDQLIMHLHHAKLGQTERQYVQGGINFEASDMV
ncbi:aspartyl-phosphate phosphatase Spo0E family protein [Paenibacillus enshidis]|uniref:Aspartyl-phosphate phosphatase Spo0E family protein n=1 Tax=Paenibacillus enshidis TaxID=1458439 RepID=A0ABV5AXL8_9BACL